MNRKYTTLPFIEYLVADGHYDTSRSIITKIVLHSSASNKQGLIDTFAGGTRMVSAHYGIDNEGELMAFLEEYNTAYACGVYTVNQSSISIEHVDEGSNVKKHTDAQYEMSAKLVADICKFYNLPCDSAHVVPHSSIVATACPNGLDVNRIINRAKIINTDINMNDRRSYWFDLINKVTFKTAWEKLNDSLINQFVKDYPGQQKRSGEFDKLCRAAGLSGDTNKIPAETVLAVLREQYSDETAIRKDEHTKTINSVKQAISAKLNEIV